MIPAENTSHDTSIFYNPYICMISGAIYPGVPQR